MAPVFEIKIQLRKTKVNIIVILKGKIILGKTIAWLRRWFWRLPLREQGFQIFSYHLGLMMFWPERSITNRQAAAIKQFSLCKLFL